MTIGRAYECTRVEALTRWRDLFRILRLLGCWGSLCQFRKCLIESSPSVSRSSSSSSNYALFGLAILLPFWLGSTHPLLLLLFSRSRLLTNKWEYSLCI